MKVERYSKDVIAERLKAIRKRKGWSLQQLADALDNKVSRQAIHKYEKAQAAPDRELLEELARLFKVPPAYFLKRRKVAVGAIQFQKVRGTRAKEEVKVTAQLREFLSQYLELQKIIYLEAKFENPLQGFRVIDSPNWLEEAAALLRQRWALGLVPIFNLTRFLEDQHVVVVEADVTFEAKHTWSQEGVPVIVYKKKLSADRLRVVLLREFAQLVLQFAPEISRRQKTKWCEQFALAVLLPERTVKQELGIHRQHFSIEELGYFKRQYGVSIQHIVDRAYHLGIVNNYYRLRFLQRLQDMGWDEEEPVVYEGVEQATRFDQLICRAVAEKLISVSKAAELKGMRPYDFRRTLSLEEELWM